MLQDYHCDDLPNVCALYEAQNADNARTFAIWFDDKFPEVYLTNDLPLSKGDSSVWN